MLLGGTVRVPIMGGKTISLNVPAATQNGKKFRISGQGDAAAARARSARRPVRSSSMPSCRPGLDDSALFEHSCARRSQS